MHSTAIVKRLDTTDDFVAAVRTFAEPPPLSRLKLSRRLRDNSQRRSGAAIRAIAVLRAAACGVEDRDERRGSLAIVRPQPVPSPCGASDLHDKWMTSRRSHKTKHQKIPPTAEGGQDLGVVRCVVRAAGERLSHRSSRVGHVRVASAFASAIFSSDSTARRRRIFFAARTSHCARPLFVVRGPLWETRVLGLGFGGLCQLRETASDRLDVSSLLPIAIGSENSLGRVPTRR